MIIRLFKILLRCWKIIINVYIEIFFNEFNEKIKTNLAESNLWTYGYMAGIKNNGQSNYFTNRTVRKAKECLKEKPIPPPIRNIPD